MHKGKYPGINSSHKYSPTTEGLWIEAHCFLTQTMRFKLFTIALILNRIHAFLIYADY